MPVFVSVEQVTGQYNKDHLFGYITYEDAISIEWKAAYVRERNLGGIMFWELSGDTRDESTSLLSVIRRELSDN